MGKIEGENRISIWTREILKENLPFDYNSPRYTALICLHMMSKEEELHRLQRGEVALEPITMKLGDVIIRDVRGLHRGTPNYTAEPRPMVVLGYSRRWLFRPEVSIQIPQATFDNLSVRARQLLRFNPIVNSLDELPETEGYQSFAY